MSRVDDLLEVLGGGDSLLIVCHDNPDPDCLASALGLQCLAEHAGIGRVTIAYGGVVSHQQNRALVNLLDIDLHRFESDMLESHDLVGFVDHSIPGRNNPLPPDTTVDVIVDHHATPEQADAAFVDVREDVGATTTILVEYLRDLDFDLSARLASALLFALHRERLDFVRHPTSAEYEAASFVYPDVDLSIPDRLYGAAFSQATLDAVGEAIKSREIRGSSLVASVGRTNERDALVQSADYLLNVEGVDTVVVFGLVGDRIQISARSTDPRLDVGDALRRAFGEVGSAGGHADMAGAQIPLGLFADLANDDADLQEFVSERVSRRFFDSLADDE